MIFQTEQDRINHIILRGAKLARVTMEDIIKIKIGEWLSSAQREAMLLGERYYCNRTDILNKRVENEKHANTKLEHGFYRKLVDQKTGYLLSKPFAVKTDNKAYSELLGKMFDKTFLRLIKNTGKECINKGIGWLYVYINESGELAFKKIPSHEVIPLWADADHTRLESVIRVYDLDAYEGRMRKTITKVEYYAKDGIHYYVYQNGELIPDVEAGVSAAYFTAKGAADETISGAPAYDAAAGGSSDADTNAPEAAYNWTEIPFVAFKYNEEEQPLITIIKSLVDDYNHQSSVNADLLADIPLFIYIIKNYGGANLEEFLSDLRAARAVKVQDDGGVDKLTAEPATAALQAHLAAERRAIYEFGRGVDTQNEEMGTASGVALKFRYADLDMDANIIDTEFQASFARLIWFINQYLLMTGQGDYTNESVDIVFNRDIIISESDVIKDCQTSKGLISDKTIVANHPYVDDVEKELAQMAKEQSEAEEKALTGLYGNGFGSGRHGVGNATGAGGDADGEDGKR